jgi:hypothetical protein
MKHLRREDYARALLFAKDEAGAGGEASANSRSLL